MNKFLKYTKGKEPALTASILGALLLAIVARYVNLTEDDLAILGPIALIIAGVVIRAGVFSPFSHQRETEDAYNEGQVDARLGVNNRDGVKGS